MINSDDILFLQVHNTGSRMGAVLLPVAFLREKNKDLKPRDKILYAAILALQSGTRIPFNELNTLRRPEKLAALTRLRDRGWLYLAVRADDPATLHAVATDGPEAIRKTAPRTPRPIESKPPPVCPVTPPAISKPRTFDPLQHKPHTVTGPQWEAYIDYRRRAGHKLNRERVAAMVAECNALGKAAPAALLHSARCGYAAIVAPRNIAPPPMAGNAAAALAAIAPADKKAPPG